MPEDSRGGGRVQAGAEVGVDVVYACEGGFDEDLAGGGGGEGDVGVQLEDFETAGVGDLDGAHGGWEGGGHGCVGAGCSSCGELGSWSGELSDCPDKLRYW